MWAGARQGGAERTHGLHDRVNAAMKKAGTRVPKTKLPFTKAARTRRTGGKRAGMIALGLRRQRRKPKNRPTAGKPAGTLALRLCRRKA